MLHQWSKNFWNKNLRKFVRNKHWDGVWRSAFLEVNSLPREWNKFITGQAKRATGGDLVSRKKKLLSILEHFLAVGFMTRLGRFVMDETTVDELGKIWAIFNTARERPEAG